MWQDSESELVEEKYDGQASKMHIYHVYIFTNKVNFVSEIAVRNCPRNCTIRILKFLSFLQLSERFLFLLLRKGNTAKILRKLVVAAP